MPVVKRDFQLTHTFKNVSKLEDGETLYSPQEEYFNVPWQISICHKGENMAFFLCCLQTREDNVPWEINAHFSVELISGKSEKFTPKSVNPTFGKIIEHGWNDFISWDTMKKDYLIDDCITIEATVKISKMTGISKKLLKSFDESNKEFSDVIIEVEGQKFYVLKKFLASHSTHFKTTFFGEFEEAGKSEITLKAIDSTDFQNVLEVLHGKSAIDDETVDGILHLADFFDMPVVIKKCEQFLDEQSEKSMKDQLKIANQYKLESLKKACLSKINTASEIKASLAGDLAEMDPTVLAALFRKALPFL